MLRREESDPGMLGFIETYGTSPWIGQRENEKSPFLFPFFSAQLSLDLFIVYSRLSLKLTSLESVEHVAPLEEDDSERIRERERIEDGREGGW